MKIFTLAFRIIVVTSILSRSSCLDLKPVLVIEIARHGARMPVRKESYDKGTLYNPKQEYGTLLPSGRR